VVGNGARSSGASELIYEFINKTHIPVLTTMNAVELIQDKYKFGFIKENKEGGMVWKKVDFPDEY
jgi:acetolactate synthase-1/2/3 large subunit